MNGMDKNLNKLINKLDTTPDMTQKDLEDVMNIALQMAATKDDLQEEPEPEPKKPEMGFFRKWIYKLTGI